MKKRNRKIIIDPEWTSHGRDTHITEPVTVFLEQYYGYKVIRTNVLFILFKLFRYKPDALLIANAGGAVDNVKWCHFANALGMKTIALTSEGLWIQYNPSIDMSEKQYIDWWLWGDNFEHEPFLDLELKWNRNAYLQFLQEMPAKKPWEVRLSGATGFDRYKLLRFESKDHFLHRYGKAYKTVVLIVGYAFYDFGNSYYHDLDLTAKQASRLGQIYCSMISSHPDVLFILKAHPTNFLALGKEWDEFKDIRGKFDNILSFCNEEDISNLLNVSDLIVSYDSTVAMEGWMLGKETVMVNPFELTFPRSDIYKGNPIVKNEVELNSVIDEFAENRSLTSFRQLAIEREKVIEENIFSDDGANFIRASKLIDEEIQNSKRKPRTFLFGDAFRELLYEIAQFFGLIIYILTRQKKRFIYQRKFMFNKIEEQKYRELYKEGINKFTQQNTQLVEDIMNGFTGKVS